MTSGPTVLWSWRESSPRGFCPVVSQVWGHRERGEKDLEDELRLAFCCDPIIDSESFLCTTQRRGHSSAFDELYTTTDLPFPTLISHTSFPISQEKWERTSCLWGLCYTDQGSRTMWFLRCSPGGERRQAWAVPCGTVVKSSALQTHGEVSPIYVKICVV